MAAPELMKPSPKQLLKIHILPQERNMRGYESRPAIPLCLSGDQELFPKPLSLGLVFPNPVARWLCHFARGRGIGIFDCGAGALRLSPHPPQRQLPEFEALKPPRQVVRGLRSHGPNVWAAEVLNSASVGQHPRKWHWLDLCTLRQTGANQPMMLSFPKRNPTESCSLPDSDKP